MDINLFARNPDNFAANCAVRCLECGRSAAGADQVRHAKSCDTPAAVVAAKSADLVARAADSGRAALTGTALQAHANRVRATACTGGNDEATFRAVQAGYLSVSDAMNTDD